VELEENDGKTERVVFVFYFSNHLKTKFFTNKLLKKKY